jgi:16S rRNA (cytosine967-C5)-methyltransferase
MVNAVLRNILRSEPDWNGLPVPTIAKWLRKLLIADYGKDVVAQIETAHAAGAPLDLTPKAGRAGHVSSSIGGELLPTGSIRLTGSRQVSALGGYEAGDWWVQDAAAAIPVKMLDVSAGEHVLDICAAPGGKTMQLADAGAEVTALDISASRMDRVRENLQRTGLSAKIVVADALDWDPPEAYDAVLLDAPCSATGTIRRHPDLPYAKSNVDLNTFVTLQSQLIDRALTYLKPGGRFVYCTCSLLHREGEAQLSAALKRHPGLSVSKAQVEGISPDWQTAAGGLRLRPDYWHEFGGMDGFFAVCLQKPA